MIRSRGFVLDTPQELRPGFVPDQPYQRIPNGRLTRNDTVSGTDWLEGQRCLGLAATATRLPARNLGTPCPRGPTRRLPCRPGLPTGCEFLLYHPMKKNDQRRCGNIALLISRSHSALA